MADDVIRLNVGGVYYTTTRATLTRFPHSTLSQLISQSYTDRSLDGDAHFFIDRDGTLFRHVLNYLRDPHSVIPDDFKEVAQLEREAAFYGIEPLVDDLARILKRTGQGAGVYFRGLHACPAYLELVECYKMCDYSYMTKGGLFSLSDKLVTQTVAYQRVTYISSRASLLKDLPKKLNAETLTYIHVKYNPTQHFPANLGPVVDLHSVAHEHDMTKSEMVVVKDINVRLQLAEFLEGSGWTLTHSEYTSKENGTETIFKIFMLFTFRS